MIFRTISDMEHLIWKNAGRFPLDADAVIGIPRSGLMAGSIVALVLNFPLGDAPSFAKGNPPAKGRRPTRPSAAGKSRRKIILVDDSVHSGESMQLAKEKLLEADPDLDIVTCAIFSSEESKNLVDLTLEVLPSGPRLFQWNVMHHPFLASSCVDIDGVLCADPSDQENDDGERYQAFLSSARPLYLPTRRIGTLVTSRLEKYRAETEGWLKANNILYDRLVMMDLPDGNTRKLLGNHSSFKGEHYRSSDALLFIESDRRQAIDIAQISGKPVLWIGGPCMIEPDRDPDVALRDSTMRIGRGLRARFKTMLLRSLGPAGFARVKILRNTLMRQ